MIIEERLKQICPTCGTDKVEIEILRRMVSYAEQLVPLINALQSVSLHASRVADWEVEHAAHCEPAKEDGCYCSVRDVENLREALAELDKARGAER